MQELYLCTFSVHWMKVVMRHSVQHCLLEPTAHHPVSVQCKSWLTSTWRYSNIPVRVYGKHGCLRHHVGYTSIGISLFASKFNTHIQYPIMFGVYWKLYPTKFNVLIAQVQNNFILIPKKKKKTKTEEHNWMVLKIEMILLSLYYWL